MYLCEDHINKMVLSESLHLCINNCLCYSGSRFLKTLKTILAWIHRKIVLRLSYDRSQDRTRFSKNLRPNIKKNHRTHFQQS